MVTFNKKIFKCYFNHKNSFLFLLILLIKCNTIKGNTSEPNPNHVILFSQDILTKYFESDLNINNILERDKDNLKCIDDMKNFVNELKNNQLWAIQMFDAWAKGPPSGILYGNTVDYGNYDQCLSINHELGNDNSFAIKGQHCSITVEIKDFSKQKYFKDRIRYEQINYKLLPQPVQNR